MAERAPLFLRLYRLLWTLGRPVVPLAFRMRLRKGKEEPERLPERRGQPSRERPEGPLVWVHAASVGELTSVIPLIEHIRSLKLNVLVTSGTVTAAMLAAQRLPQGAIHQFSPVDATGYVRRFLDHWRPQLALLVESDLWPNLILESAARSVPLILVNGRLSQRSFRRWKRLPQMIAPLLQRLDLCLARNNEDGHAFRELGAPRVIITGNLKFDVPAPPANADKLRMLRAAISDRPVFGAASTHPGEDEIVIAAYRMLRMRIPGLLTAIAPRHPERGSSIAQIAAAAGLRTAQRSRGQFPTEATDIYIYDTIGELGLFYSVSPIVFIGGSLIEHGGQNPIEAAKLGAAILHGPHVGNFTEIYAALDKAHGATQIADAQMLAQRVNGWLHDEAARAGAAHMAREVVDGLGGALDKTLLALEPYLMQLRLGQGQNNHA